MIRVPESSNPMNPRSKRWSMLGVINSPFSPSRRSSLEESPRLGVARDQHQVVDASDAAAGFDAMKRCLKRP
jgi:hypothetical protein